MALNFEDSRTPVANQSKKNLEDSDSEVQDVANDRKYFLADNEKPIRTLVMLHAEPVWISVILSTIVIQTLMILYNVSFRGKLLNFTKEPKDYSMQSYLILMDGLYCADFLLAFLYRSWKSISCTESGVQPRKNIYLIVDLASLIPIDIFLWYGTNLAFTNTRVFYLWSLNRLLRIYRVYSFFYTTRNSCAYVSVKLHMLEILTSLVVLSMISTVILFEWKINIEKQELPWLEELVKNMKIETFTTADWFQVCYYVILGHVSSHGTIVLPRETNHLLFTIISLIVTLTVRSLLLAYMVDNFHRRDYAKSIFRFKRMVLGELLGSTVTKPTMDQIYKRYALFWETQGAQNLTIDQFVVYPLIFRAECSLELSWDMFKHSQLFRNMPIPFLRNVSLLCERKFVLPGDFILKKFGLKDRMIYIVSGNVYVLSEEDNETPILSFSGGTILGETSLFTSYRSGVSVLAYTPCELHVLERNKFARVIIPLYPKIYEEIINTINSRLENAKFMRNIGVYLKKNENIFNNDRNTDVAWLKSVLGVLQGAVRPDGKSEDIERRMKLMEKVYDAVDIRYTFRFLDTLVLSDNIALTTDAVFLRSSKCPWILKPDSPVLLIWDTIVLVCTIILSYILTVSLTFPEYETDSIYAWTRFLGLVATADFCVTICTAIQKNDSIIIIKVSQILKIRLHHWSFWLDLVAAIPWVFLISNQYGFLRLLRLNRMLKLYKLELMSNRIENTHRISITTLRTIKYGLYMMLTGFFLTAIAVIMSCSTEAKRTTCSPTSWISIALTDHEQLKDNIFRYPLLVVYQTILGIGTPIGRPASPTECAYWIFMMIVGALLYVFNVSSLSSVKILSQVILAKQFHLRQAIQYHLNQTMIPEVLKKRVDSYLDTERCYDKGYRISTNEDVLATLPSEVSAKWKYERFGSLLSSVPLFMETSTEFIKDICYIATVGILPPKELLSYGGRHCTEMYIIEKGYCEMIHMEPSIPHRTVGAGTAIYPVEMCLQLPVVHTVVTSTYLSFVTINRSDFLRVYSNYPEEKFEFDQLLSEFLKMEQVVELHEVVKEKPEFIDALDAVRPPIPSFTFFEYTINKEDPEYYVINEPFEKLKNLKFIKWFLLRLTLRPDGTFIKFYEAQRCVFAIMAVIFYTMRIVIEAENFTTLVSKIITFLNVTAVLDIYVRMHVGYFNEKGLLITHPLATATHYMKTSMILDVLGILPFEAMVPHATENSRVLFYSYLTRIIQLHRFLGATNYLQESDSWTSVIKYGKFIPILVVVAHVFACVILYESCTFDGSYEENEQFGAGVRCPQDQSFIKSSDNYKLTMWLVYQRSLYIAISTFTRVGVDEMQIKTISGMNIFCLMSAVTFMVLLLLTAQMIADSAIRDGELTAYQDRMTTMVKFMHNKRITPELYKEVIYYFELIWKHRRGQSVDRLIKTFHSALREDVLCALFSKSLSKCPGFVNAGETFYRYLLMHMQSVRFFPNGAVIVHYNDVLDFVDVIHTGSAEVVAPDGSYVTTLGPGSIFGNLIGTTTVRMPVSMVVNAHMEALVFEAPQFFRALSIHRKARQIFLSAIELNSDYLPGIIEDHEVYVSNEDLSSGSEVPQSKTIFRVFKFLSMRVVDPNWMVIKLWDRNSLFISCYFSPCAIIYQNAYGDFHRNWICIQYITDFLFLTMMYLRVHSAFEDVHGNIVRDKRRIWNRFLKSPMGFYAHLVSVVPIELIALVFTGKTMRKTYCLLRLNRTLRLAVVADFFNVQCKKLNINIFKMRLAYLVLLLFFILHLASCVLVTMTVKIDPYDFDDLSRRKAYFKDAFHIASMYAGSITRRLPTASSGYYVAYILTLEIMMFVTFALIVGDMCAMIDVRHYVMVTYERVIRQFKSYMERCDLTYVLRKNLWNYGCNLWEFNRGRQIPHLVLEAPNYLRREVKNAMFIHHLEIHEIFSGCHEDFLRQVCDAFILINFFPDDLIVNVGDINGNMYFINTGRILTIHYHRDNLSKEKGREIYEEGRTFGFPSGFFPSFPHRATHRAFGKCKILILNRNKWIYLLDHFPASKNHILNMAKKFKGQYFSG